MDATAKALLAAQSKAEALFAEIVAAGLIKPEKLESELTAEIHELAQSRFGLRRHWHKRIVRAGPNTLLSYNDETVDRRIMADDVVYLDFGPVFDEWEADFGRSYAVGSDAVKHRLVRDIESAFWRGVELYRTTPELTTGELYDYVVGLAGLAGWEFGAKTAGHLIGQFPHESGGSAAKRLSIRHGNDLALRTPDAAGRMRHWILEIHFIDRSRQIGGFFEQLLIAQSS